MTSGHEGHRQRLLKKLPTGTLADHELLELLFFFSIPRRNTNDLAHLALSEFGSLSDLFAADISNIQQIEGIGPNTTNLLMCVQQLCERSQKKGERTFPKKFEFQTFLNYVKKSYAPLSEEVFDVYLLKSNNDIFLRKRFSSQSISSVTVNVQEFAALLAINRPAGVVIVHNHPSGNANPSEKDDATTLQCVEICRLNNAMLCDHVIYSQSETFSYYHSGRLTGELMKKISQKGFLFDGIANKD